MRLRNRKQRFKLRPTSLPGSVFFFFFHSRGEILGTNLGARAASSLQYSPWCLPEQKLEKRIKRQA